MIGVDNYLAATVPSSVNEVDGLSLPSKAPETSKTANFANGLCKLPFMVLIVALRTWASFATTVSITIPLGQLFLGRSGSTITNHGEPFAPS